MTGRHDPFERLFTAGDADYAQRAMLPMCTTCGVRGRHAAGCGLLAAAAGRSLSVLGRVVNKLRR